MSGPDSIRIVLKGARHDAGAAIKALRHFAAETGLPAALQNDLSIIVDEVVSNWLGHGHAGGKPSEMEIQARLNAGQLHLRFADSGPPYNPLLAPAPYRNLPLEKRPPGGMGVLLVRELTDLQTYARVGDRNVLELRRSIGK